MSFVRPTLTELVDRIQEDFLSSLQLVAPILRRSMVYVMSRVLAGTAHMLHGHMGYLSRQVFPDLSDEEYLIRQAALFGIIRTAATYAAGNVVFVGTDTTVIPAGTVLLRSDGSEYTTDGEETIATLTAWATTTTYAVGDLRTNGGNIYQCAIGGESAGSGGPTGEEEAIVDNEVTWRYIAAGSAAVLSAVTTSLAGEDGCCEAGVELSLESPIAGANSTAIVDVEALVGGTDQETVDALRVRLLERMQSPPHGGNEADYIAWAKEIAGVTRAWCYPMEDGPGTVTVRFVRDNDDSIFPDAGEVTAVQDHIDEVRPVTADVTVEAPVDDPIAMTIEIVPDTSDTRAAVEAELQDLLFRTAEPGVTTLLSQLEIAVGTAEGITDFSVTVPATDVTHAAGYLATLGVITWV
jgi:uncharacterized phage protein gp47/JayE